MTTYVWLYQSNEVQPLTSEGIMDILRTSRLHNKANNISGMLLYNNGRFTQIIEGEKSVIRGLKEKIGSDPRHKDITTVFEGIREDRVFAQWSMAFHNPTREQVELLDAYIPLGWGQKTLTKSDAKQDISGALLKMAEWVSEVA